MYVKMVSNGGIGTEFILNVTPISYQVQGTSGAPQILVSTPTWDAAYAGIVDNKSSYYQVPVDAGELYRVGLANVSGDVSLTVYDDANLSTQLCSSNAAGLVDESCQTTPSGSNVWIVVNGDTYSSKFDLSVDRVYVQQGNLASPLDIIGSLPLTYTGGETGPGTGGTERSHLMAALTAGKSYTVAVSNHTDADLSVWVFDNADFLWPTICMAEDYNGHTRTINSLSTSTVYIWVTSDDPYGSGFDLTITETP